MGVSPLRAAARRRALGLRRQLAEDLRRSREDAGVSQRALASATGLSQGFVSRILAGDAAPSHETYALLGAALGADFAARFYPSTGPRIRDRFSAPMAELLLSTARPRWLPHPEVGVHRPARGWIDLVLHDPRANLVVASELQSLLRRLEQLLRWHALKVESLPSWEGFHRLGDEAPAVSRLLVVRRTRATRQVAAEFGGLLRSAYPAHPDDALDALGGTAPWPGAALVWMTIDGRGARWASGR
jgi:transcriptional regulator with XRE-family HTH domain